MHTRDLSDHEEYVPGEGIEEVARELGVAPGDLTKLASNENALGASPDAVAAIREHADRTSAYPTAAHTDLTAAIADRWDVAPEQIWLSPGADGAIDLLHRATIDPDQAVLAPDRGFAYYPMSARYHHGAVETYPVPRDQGFRVAPADVLEAYDGERVVFLTSPHNPTGRTIPLAEVREIAEGTDDETLVVVDEAYGEFADVESARALLDEREDVAVLRTFSKAYGLAGMRIGYALVPAEWADAYARINTPFAVSELGCRAGLAALADEEHVAESVELARWSREYVREELATETWPSQANFVLARVGDAAAVTEAAKERGVILRDCTSFGLDDCVRITTGTKPETREAVEVLNEILAERADASDPQASTTESDRSATQ